MLKFRLPLRWAFLPCLLALLLACPGPAYEQQTLKEAHLFDLDQGTVVALRATAMVAGGEGPSMKDYRISVGPSWLQPPARLTAPKAMLVPNSQPYVEIWVHFLEVPGGTPSYVSYRYSPYTHGYVAGLQAKGPVAHPGGRIGYVSPESPLAGLSYVAWGTEAPYLVGYSVDAHGSLAVWPYLPELTSAPMAVSVKNDLLYVAEAQGRISLFRLQEGQAPQALQGLDLAAPIHGIAPVDNGLLVLRDSPALLQLYPQDASGLGGASLSGLPLAGTPLSLEASDLGQILVTSTEPQALTRAALRNQILERKSVLVAIKNDFMVLQPRGFYRGMDSSQVLLDASQGQGFWLKGWGDGTGDRFSLPISRYAPIQMVDARR